MASKSKAFVSPWNKVNPGGKSNAKSRLPVPNKSWQRTAIEKLKKHPSFTECGQNQLAIEAKDLIDPESIMNTYFSEIVHHPVADRVDEQVQESESVFVTSVEVEAGKERSIWRVEDTAKLEVKLLLRGVDTPLPNIARKAASILQMEYGPLHTSLLINGEILLEWNTSSLVIPERYDGMNQRYPIMTSAMHRVNTVSLITYDPKDETDLLFQAARSKIDILNALIRVISRYNGQYYYHTLSRNCQTFVVEALKAMGCENPPQFEGRLLSYFQKLKAGNCQPEFETHNELDQYVVENVINAPAGTRLSSQEKEYLLGQYFLHHIRGLTEAEEPEQWACPVGNCQMKNLEAHVDEHTMIMHKFLHIEEKVT